MKRSGETTGRETAGSAQGLALRVNGVELAADPSGALFWPAARTVVFADLHFEKGSAFARRGSLLPPYDTAATLDRLEAVLARLAPARVICLGDSFHDHGAAERVAARDGARLERLTAAHDWIWVCGNHDPRPPERWGGCVAGTLTEGALLFRHKAVDGPAPGEISGHFHPKAGLWARGRWLTTPCFASDGRRLILPAFGAYAGGMHVLDPALAAVFGGRLDEVTVHLLGGSRLHSFPARRLPRDPGSFWQLGEKAGKRTMRPSRIL